MTKAVEPQKTQVIIIGAGPTGLSLASQLLRYGIDFVILEKNEKTTPFSKAVVVQARTLEIFQEIGLAEKALSEGKVTTGLNLFYKGIQKAAVQISGLGEGLSPFPFALSLEQSKTEKLLLDCVTEKTGTVLWKSEFRRFEQSAEEVKVYYTDAKGEEQTIQGEYLIGCDGASSLVRHQMGLAFEGDTVPKIFYIADVKLSSPVINKNELFIFLIKKGFVLFFPMEGPGHYRMVGILPNATPGDQNMEFEQIKEDISGQMAIPVNFEELRWFSTYKVHSRKAGSFSNGRCFIAGDAAHIHTPAGGQGMNTGIQDGYNLAWKLAYFINQKVNRSVLESYSSERVENALHLLRTTDRMFDVMAGSSPFWNFVRLRIFPVIVGIVSKNALVKKKIFPLISQTGIAYPNSSLTLKSSRGRIKSGDRMPFMVFPDGTEIFSYLKDPAFKVLFFGRKEDSHFDPLKELALPVETFCFSEIPKPMQKSLGGVYVFVRPDNHISYIGKDLEACIRWASTMLGK
jgi:2-polyprenyl-6-methoxyphenol hydroxylase-like FAD-dependent oxidoreductase